jgi:hypothetical protein
VLVKLQKPTVTVYFKLILLAHIALNLDYFHIMTHAISLLNCALSRIFVSFMRYLYTLTLFRRHRIYSLLLQIKLYTHRQKLHNINTTKSLQEVSDRQNSREGDARHDRRSRTPQHKGPGTLTAVLYCVNPKSLLFRERVAECEPGAWRGTGRPQVPELSGQGRHLSTRWVGAARLRGTATRAECSRRRV